MQKFKATDRQAQIDWEGYFNNYIAEVEAATNESDEERKERIKKLEKNFENWKQYYFPKYCYAPSAKFHKQSAKRKLQNPEWYEVDMWARELAKDVSEMVLTLFQTLTGVKRNILFISNNWDKAAELLEPFRINLAKNKRIINDYGIQEMPGSWKYGDFVTAKGVSFLAVGAGQSPRGSRNEDVRPDKVIVSDIDTDEDVRNTDIIDKRWEWFEKAVFPTRSISKDTQYVWLGNKIAKDCCVVRASAMADYHSIVNIVDKNGNSTWPEKNKPEHVERIRSKLSTAAFEGEYMNNPVTKGSTFKEMYWGKCPPLRKLKFVVVYGDPAPSNRENKKNSFKACFIVGKYEGRTYVYTGWLNQAKNETFVEWFYDAKEYIKDRTQAYYFIENNSLQDPFFEQVFIPLFKKKATEKGCNIPVSPDERKKPDKFARIEGNLEPLNRRGDLVLNEAERGNPNMQKLEEQFLMINPQLNAPADGPDCIEGGEWVCNNKLNNYNNAITIGRRHRNKKRY